MTILFADICRSTELFEQLGDVQAYAVINEALGKMSALVEAAGGKIIKSLGDELMCSFAEPAAAAGAACQMQQQIPLPLPDGFGQLELRIGFHHGEVLHRREQGTDDVFGDAVNVAARLAASAKAGQILASADSLFDSQHYSQRAIGSLSLKGRQQPVATIEVIWQQDESQLTAVARPVTQADLRAAMRLKLKFALSEGEMTGSSFPTTIGRDTHNDLIVDQALVSRHHASIEARDGYFVLIDKSTNGTFVAIGEENFELRRSELRLRQSGAIHLGARDAEPIHFSLA